MHIHSWGWGQVVKSSRYWQRDNMPLLDNMLLLDLQQGKSFLKSDRPITCLLPWDLSPYNAKRRPRQEEQTLPLLNFKKIYSVLKVKIKGAINALGKCSTFLKILQPLSWHGNLGRSKYSLLVSKPCALWQLEGVPGAVPEVHRNLYLCPQYWECASFSREEKSLPQDEREGWKCEGQFIISILAGHQDWTLNKLCQDICSELAFLAVLHKQKSAGVQHVERLLNRVINLYKQKKLPKKHISSHCTPGYKAELSCKLIHISCLLEPQRRAQASCRGESTETYRCTLLVRSNGTGQIYSVMITWHYFFPQQQCKLFKDGHILKWLGS